MLLEESDEFFDIVSQEVLVDPYMGDCGCGRNFSKKTVDDLKKLNVVKCPHCRKVVKQWFPNWNLKQILENKQLDKFEKKYQELSDKNDKLEEKIDLVLKGIVEMNNNFEDTKRENKMLMKKIDVLESENEKLDKEMEEIKKENNELKRSINLSPSQGNTTQVNNFQINKNGARGLGAWAAAAAFVGSVGLVFGLMYKNSTKQVEQKEETITQKDVDKFGDMEKDYGCHIGPF